MKLFLIFFPYFIFSQQIKKLDSVFCDCLNSRTVLLKGNSKIGPTIPPPNSRNVNEISELKQKTKFAFEKEHNSAWYKLIIKSNGNLVFDIIPTNANDDYDFMLFKGASKDFCDSMQKFHIKPIRACISRNKEKIKGLTGLKYSANKEMIKEGLGDAYAKPIEVKDGEIYYLVLDNVYKDGAGHSINFYFEENITINGLALDENKKPVKAEITITSQKGDTIKKLNSDKNGKYNFDVALRRNFKYSLNFYNDSTFFDSKEITTKTNKDTLKNIITLLPTLKKGNKYTIQNINFYPGHANVLPSAFPSLKNLVRLMRKNEGLKLLIVGHVNGCEGEPKSVKDQLSKSRAITVKKFLVTNSIANGRITTDGKGCDEMLFPLNNETPEWQQVLNRRVEIFIVEK
ncbi:MAG: OmpA family protein [Bacteroidota bacterium]|nr:OmpA family protein [Bacteroidota bacterium]MDP3146748.1 OmpA family protein [Bacteroidota bacterium]